MTLTQRLTQLLRVRKFQVVLVCIAIIALLPLLISNTFIISEVLTPMIIFTIYASSWNLLASSGQGSLGHAAFLGIGGFASALIASKLGVPPIIGLFVGGVFSAAIGLLIGLACVRLKAWFLAMVTFGFSVIAATLIRQFDPVTQGITGFPTPLIVPRGVPFYYVTLVLAVISIFTIYWVMRSKVGLAFKVIHQNELEAKMIGVNTAKYKLLAFVISTFFAGLAGGLYAQSIRYIQVSVFDPYYSFLPLMMVVIGGIGTIEGPIIGSVIIVSIESYLGPGIDPILQGLIGGVSNVGPYLRFLGLGLFLIVIVILLPKGIASLIPRVYNYFRTSPPESKKI